MTEEEYLAQRLDDQIDWYGAKSKTNQDWHKSLRLVEIVCAAIIPFVAGFSQFVPYNEIVVGVCGVVIAISVGMSALNKYQENWATYRTTAEMLKHERFLFLTKSAPYGGADAFQTLVRRVESLISKENSQWSEQNKDNGK